MKKLLMVLLLFSGLLIGCTSGESAREHHRRLKLQNDLQLRTLVDDLDYVFLLERNCRLSRWCTRIGY